MDVGTIVIVTIAVALIFDIINGFHDAANSIATVVSTRVLSPRLAVLWATVFNFVALFIFQQGVANTIAGVQAGAVQVQGTMNGYGERTGNANLCSIVPVLKLKLGLDCISDEDLARLEVWLERFATAQQLADIGILPLAERN